MYQTVASSSSFLKSGGRDSRQNCDRRTTGRCRALYFGSGVGGPAIGCVGAPPGAIGGITHDPGGISIGCVGSPPGAIGGMMTPPPGK
jgi:hypothetical protein